MRKWLAPLLTSAIALAVAGAVLAQSPAAKPQWTVALNEEAESVDPASSVLFASDIYHVHMFDSLVGLEGDELKPVPLLAERWEIVNPTTWRFRLRKGVKFHDGAAFDAQDVKYSFDTYLDPKNRRATFAKGITRVEVKDAYTVDVITSEPLASALFNVVRMYILPKDAREKMGAQAFSQHPIGTGPYKLVEWKRDQQLVLEANPGYWRGAVNPKRLVFRPIKDSATRAAELRSGGVDIIAAPSVPQLELLDSGDTRVVPVKGGRVIIYLMNVKQPPFDNKKVREAVNLAVNREAIVKNVLGGRGVVLAGPFTPAWLGYDPAIKPFPYDPARARQLLAEAGQPQGFETTWSITSGVFLKDTEIAEAMAGQLRQVGVRLKLVPTERSKIQKDGQEGTFHRHDVDRVGDAVRARRDAGLGVRAAPSEHAADHGAGGAGARRGRPGEAPPHLPGSLPPGPRRGALALRPRPGRAVGGAEGRPVDALQRRGSKAKVYYFQMAAR